MELDSIIYIVIAIALAIINAIAQKKKKAQQKNSPVHSTVDYADEFDSVEEVDLDIEEQIENLGDMLKVKPLEVLFGGTEHVNEYESVPETVAESKLVAAPEPVRELTDFELKMQETAQRMMGDIGDHSIPEFDEDSIASSAITNALTLEEEEIAFNESRSDLLKDFDPRKAIVYAEIIKPKYFSIGV
jgi:hypothetical protein